MKKEVEPMAINKTAAGTFVVDFRISVSDDNRETLSLYSEILS